MIGETLGPYALGRELGSGGMGRVYAATLERSAAGLDAGTTVALKVVHAHLLDTEGFFKRFLREAEIGKSVRHENVVRTLDCDAIGGSHFLVMEYVEGQTLRDLADELGNVPEELCRHVAREIAKGLGAIHAAGVVHRDLKPENVLITADHQVKVMDLGVARLADESIRLSQTGAFVGSLHYAAPESFRDDGKDVDGRADLHALGLVLYELSCGANPYLADDIPKTVHKVLHEEPRRLGDANPQLSAFFEEMVHCLLAKDCDKRFADAAELLAVLDAGEESTWWNRRASLIRNNTKRPLRRIRIPRETAVYGREKELAKLRSLYDRAKSGEGQVVLIEGEAGIGKSRLVDELIGRLQSDGEDLNFLFGSYPPGGAALAAGGFSSAYREQLGADGSPSYLQQTPLLVPGFDAVLRGEPSPEDALGLTKDSLQTCFVHVTRALAAERTTVVLIDDLHFAPEDARALFTSLALAVPGHRVLLLGTARPGVPEEWVANLTRPEHVAHMQVDRLGPKDLVRLLQDSFKSERLAEQLGIKIALKSDGNPFFAFEIIRGLREGQFITRKDDGTWVTTRVIDDIRIPSSVLDLVNARVADLTEEQRDLLDVACCWGFEFDPSLVAAALGIATIPALKRLSQIERRHRLVRSSGNDYVFDHHQVQEALYSALHNRLREHYHGALAGALASREGADGKEPSELDAAVCVDLCEHYLKGAANEDALRYIDAALTHLRTSYLFAQAAGLAERVLAAKGLLTGVERAKVLLHLASSAARLGDHVSRRRAGEEAELLVIEAGDDELAARAAFAVAGGFNAEARFTEAEDAARRAIEAARRSGDQVLECAALGTAGMALHFQGRLDESRELLERRFELARSIGHRPQQGTGNLAAHFVARGQFEEARTCLENTLALMRETRNRHGEATITGDLGSTVYSQGLGRYADAIDLIGRSVTLCREIGNRSGEAMALTNLGWDLITVGRLDASRERLRTALALCREIGLRRGEGYVLHALGDAAAALGENEVSERRYRDALSLRRETLYPSGVAQTLQALGALLAATGRDAEAAPLLLEADETARSINAPDVQVLSRCHLALLPGGDAAAARAAFLEFGGRLGVAERMVGHFLLWRADHEPADLAEAHRLLLHARDHAPEDCRETILENVPLHRDIMAAWRARSGAHPDEGECETVASD